MAGVVLAGVVPEGLADLGDPEGPVDQKEGRINQDLVLQTGLVFQNRSVDFVRIK